MRTPLVAARTVAQALADLATGRGPAAVPEAAGPPIPEIAGPRAENLVDMATLLAAARIPGEGRGREQAGRPRTATSIREDLVAELPRFRAIREKHAR
jgi:hypothetical protein